MTVDRAPAPPVSAATSLAAGPAPWLEVDGRRCRLATRALVLGVPRHTGADGHGDSAGAGGPVEHLVAEGADLVERADGSGGFVADPDAAAGAQRLAAWAAAGTTVLLGVGAVGDRRGSVGAALAGRLLAARAAGVEEGRVALDVGPRLDEVELALALGRPVAVSAIAGDPAVAVGLATAAVARGARIVRTDQVRAVRRAVDVLAAVLEEL